MASTELTSEETAVYDRQIRLWGVEAQQNIRKSAVLIVGVNGVTGEIAKNLVLAGIGKLSLMDTGLVEECDLGAQFFLRQDDVGQHRAKAVVPRIKTLNPHVAVDCIIENIDDLIEKNSDFLDAFQFVIMNHVNIDSCIRVNELCRSKKINFYMIEHHGMYGMIFCDLLHHEYLEEKNVISPTDKDDIKTLSTKKDIHCITLHDAFQRLDKEPSTKKRMALLYLYQYFLQMKLTEDVAENINVIRDALERRDPRLLVKLEDKLIEQFLRTRNTEFSPVCAILGGVVAQEVIKVMSHKDCPVASFFVFDANNGANAVERFE